MPLISIIVPVYKVKEEYLRQCIESLMNQTFQDIEIILVDDGTPDNGGMICDEYAQKDKRIRVIHQDNQGVSAARNNGLDIATGEWITFVDADDWIELNTCEILQNHITQKDLDLIIFALKINSSNEEGENPFWNNSNIYLDKDELNELQIQILHKAVSRYSPPYNMVGVAVCKLYKHEFLKELNLRYNESLSLSEDGIFVFTALQYAEKVIYINEFLYHYRKHGDSATHRFRKDVESNHERALKEFEKLLIEYNKDNKFYTALYHRALLNIYAISDQFYCNQDNPMPSSQRIEGIRKLCNSKPYLAAINEIKIIEYFKSNSYFRGIGFCLLKFRAYTAFYYLSLFKNNIKRIRKK